MGGGRGGVVAYPGRTTLIAIRCEYTPVAFKVNPFYMAKCLMKHAEVLVHVVMYTVSSVGGRAPCCACYTENHGVRKIWSGSSGSNV